MATHAACGGGISLSDSSPREEKVGRSKESLIFLSTTKRKVKVRSGVKS